MNIRHKHARRKKHRSKISVKFTLVNGRVFGVLKNNGHSPVVTVNVTKASAQLTNVPHHRENLYILKKVYFRFGCSEKEGSEHQIDGVPTPGEVCKTNLTPGDISQAVVGSNPIVTGFFLSGVILTCVIH